MSIFKANHLLFKLYIFNYANTLFPEHESDVVVLQKENTDKIIKPRTRLNIGNNYMLHGIHFWGLSNLPSPIILLLSYVNLVW